MPWWIKSMQTFSSVTILLQMTPPGVCVRVCVCVIVCLCLVVPPPTFSHPSLLSFPSPLPPPPPFPHPSPPPPTSITSLSLSLSPLTETMLLCRLFDEHAGDVVVFRSEWVREAVGMTTNTDARKALHKFILAPSKQQQQEQEQEQEQEHDVLPQTFQATALRQKLWQQIQQSKESRDGQGEQQSQPPTKKKNKKKKKRQQQQQEKQKQQKSKQNEAYAESEETSRVEQQSSQAEQQNSHSSKKKKKRGRKQTNEAFTNTATPSASNAVQSANSQQQAPSNIASAARTGASPLSSDPDSLAWGEDFQWTLSNHNPEGSRESGRGGAKPWNACWAHFIVLFCFCACLCVCSRVCLRYSACLITHLCRVCARAQSACPGCQAH